MPKNVDTDRKNAFARAKEIIKEHFRGLPLVGIVDELARELAVGYTVSSGEYRAIDSHGTPYGLANDKHAYKVFRGEVDNPKYIVACAAIIENEVKNRERTPGNADLRKSLLHGYPDFKSYLSDIYYGRYKEAPPQEWSDHCTNRYKAIEACIGNLKENSAPSETSLAIFRVLRCCSEPPVFYDWIQKHSALHWLDFMFLLVLRRLQHECGCVAYANVTMEISAEKLVRSIARDVTAILGNPPTELTTIQHLYQARYEAHAQTYADAERRAQLAPNRRDWLQYKPWFVDEQCNKRGYLKLQYHKTKPEHDFAHAYIGRLEVGLIPTRTITLDGVGHGKAPDIHGMSDKSTPVPPLCIIPPLYPDFRNWIVAGAPLGQLRALVKYLEDADGNVRGRAQDLRVQKTSLAADYTKALPTECDPEYADSASRLVRLFEYWNARYFSEKSPAGST